MGGSREVEYSPIWLAQKALVSNGQASMKVGRDGTLLMSEHRAEQIRRLGLDPKKITAVQALQAIHVISEDSIGVARAGVPHSLRTVRSTPAIQTAEIAVQLMEIHTRVGAPGSKPKHSVAEIAGGFIGGFASVGEHSRHQHRVHTAKTNLTTATQAANRPAMQLGGR
jgi:hypothetical protein